MVAKTRIHTTPGEDVKIKAGKGKKKDTRGKGHPVGKAGRRAAEAKARIEAEKKRKHAVDVRSGRIAGSKPTLSSRLRIAAARVPLGAGYFARSGGGGGSRK